MQLSNQSHEIAVMIISSLKDELEHLESLGKLKIKIVMNKETRLCVYKYIIDFYTNGDNPEYFKPIKDWTLFGYTIKIDNDKNTGECFIIIK